MSGAGLPGLAASPLCLQPAQGLLGEVLVDALAHARHLVRQPPPLLLLALLLALPLRLLAPLPAHLFLQAL